MIFCKEKFRCIARFLLSLAKEPVLEGLERCEEMTLSAIAEIRDTAKAERIKHTDVWK